MHTYKDAILNSLGAYVLYPGDKAGLFQVKDDYITPSIGALPLKPGGSHNTFSLRVEKLLNGLIYSGEVRLMDPEITGEFARYLTLCDKHRTMKVRTNADTPQMAEDAIKNGAEGIGLCRTERMFNAQERLPKVVDMIVADTVEERE